MDSKSDLKILTETLLKILQSHSDALKSEIPADLLPHVKLLEGIMDKIQSYELKVAVPVKELTVSTSITGVINSIDPEIKTPQEDKIETQEVPEGPKQRGEIVHDITDFKKDIATPKMNTRPAVPTENLTPENIDKFADLMVNDSPEEPEIKPLKPAVLK